jgi:hypothetical protein
MVRDTERGATGRGVQLHQFIVLLFSIWAKQRLWQLLLATSRHYRYFLVARLFTRFIDGVERRSFFSGNDLLF